MATLTLIILFHIFHSFVFIFYGFGETKVNFQPSFTVHVLYLFSVHLPPPPHTHLSLGCECPYLVYYGFFWVHLLEFCIEVLVGVCTPLIIGSVSREENGQTDGRGTISCLGLLKIKISHSS